MDMLYSRKLFCKETNTLRGWSASNAQASLICVEELMFFHIYVSCRHASVVLAWSTGHELYSSQLEENDALRVSNFIGPPPPKRMANTGPMTH